MLINGKRYAIVSFFLPILFLLIIWKLYLIQIVHNPDYQKRARRYHRVSLSLDSERGKILDRKGKVLAFDVTRYSVFYRPVKENWSRGEEESLATVLGMEMGKIRQKLKKKRFVYLARGVEEEVIKKLEKLNLKGIGWEREKRRFYPCGSLASQVIGFTGVDNQGLAGVEYYYDSFLKGKKGEWITERDGRGVLLASVEEKYYPPVPGKTVILTLDEGIQYLLEKELKKTHEETRAKRSVGIMVNPQSGEILAMASLPDYNPNQYQFSSPRNWAIGMVYEPGSTFKVITLSIALEEKVVEPEQKIFCERGSFPFYGHLLHDHHPYGWLTVKETLWFSSNIGLTKIGMKVGEERLYNYIKKFGFGEKTGIDLPGEEKGILRPLSHWSKVSMAAIPFGQEIGVTPIQLAMAVSAIANGGYLLKPYVVKEIRDKEGRIVYRGTRKVKRRAISSETARLMRQLMEGVVEKGTGRKAQIEGFRVAGKTGTAQKYVPGEGYDSGKFVASFVGFIPVEKPQFLLLLVIDEPEGLYYGGEIAAPCFKRVMEGVIRYCGMSPRDLRG